MLGRSKRVMRRNRLLKWLLLSAITFFTVVTLLTQLKERSGISNVTRHQSHITDEYQMHRLCLLVPFRDRMAELTKFAPHMKAFLEKQGISYTVIVVDQADSLRFNRGSLLNVGFLYSEENHLCDYVALHDVDLLPLNQHLSYTYPKSGPRHLSPPGLHPKYDYSTFLGGILLLRSDHFRLVNGFSNRYWGWGLEDDEFRVRLTDAHLNISRPENVKTGKQNTFGHIHSAKKRTRDYSKCYNQRDVTRRRDRETGLSLHSLSYSVDSVEELVMPSESKVLMLHVHLHCDATKTPWCDCSNAPDKEMPLTHLDPKDNIMPRLKKRRQQKPA